MLRAAAAAVIVVSAVAGAAGPARADHTAFDKGQYEVVESAEFIELTISSSPCCPTGSGQFDYHTTNLTATAGSDYTQTSGTITTASCGCKITVPILGDNVSEGEELFQVRLTNFRGTWVNTRESVTVVKIIDDDQRQAVSSGGSPAAEPVARRADAGRVADSSSAASAAPPAADRSSATGSETYGPELETIPPSKIIAVSAPAAAPVRGSGLLRAIALASWLLAAALVWKVRPRGSSLRPSGDR